MSPAFLRCSSPEWYRPSSTSPTPSRRCVSGLHLLLFPLAIPDVRHGLAQRPIARRIAVEQLAEVGHRGDVERSAIHDRTDVSRHHLGHAIHLSQTPCPGRGRRSAASSPPADESTGIPAIGKLAIGQRPAHSNRPGVRACCAEASRTTRATNQRCRRPVMRAASWFRCSHGCANAPAG